MVGKKEDRVGGGGRERENIRVASTSQMGTCKITCIAICIMQWSYNDLEAVTSVYLIINCRRFKMYI